MHNRQAITIRNFLRTVADHRPNLLYAFCAPYRLSQTYVEQCSVQYIPDQPTHNSCHSWKLSTGTSSYEAYCSYYFGHGLARGS